MLLPSFGLRVQVFPVDHGKGNSEHPHNGMLIHCDNCDHGGGGGWMGRRGGYVFVAEGGGETENWVWLIVLRRGQSVGFLAHMTSRRRGRTHKVSNLQIMCQSFVRTNMYSFRLAWSACGSSWLVLLYLPATSVWGFFLVQTEGLRKNKRGMTRLYWGTAVCDLVLF